MDRRPPARLHVVYLHQHFATRAGTTGGRSHEFARLLVQRGHRVTMVAGASDHSGLSVDRLISRQVLDGIELIVVDVPYAQEMSMRRRAQAFLKFMLLSSAVCARLEDADVVFASSTPLTIAVPGLLAALAHRAPFVFEVRDLWPEIPIRLGFLKSPAAIWTAHRLERLAYRRARRIVALSPGMKSAIVAGGVPAERVAVIPNSSDVELLRRPDEGERFRREHPELGARPLIVHAGTFGRVNGLDWVPRLAQAVARIDPSPCFLLIGRGSEKPGVIARAKELGVYERNLFCMEPRPRAELAPALNAATLLSCFFIPEPVIEHNSANKFFDALAVGKPVVINYGGWQADLLAESGAGLRLDHHDVEASAETLVAALSDEEWLARAARASASLGQERFERSKLATELEEVLRAAVDESRP